MPRYTTPHYEDVARLVKQHRGHLPADPMGSSVRVHIGHLAESFADLFAADNPPVCRWCTAPVEPSPTNCPKSALGQHTYLGGFNRAEFLRACGIEEGA